MRLILAAYGARLLAHDFETVTPDRSTPATSEERDIETRCLNNGWVPMGWGDPWESPWAVEW